MADYSKECLVAFLEGQDRLFDEPVAETLEEAEEFLEEVMAEVVDNADDLRDYLEEIGMDTYGMDDEELMEQAEVFSLPSGGFLVVQG